MSSPSAALDPNMSMQPPFLDSDHFGASTTPTNPEFTPTTPVVTSDAILHTPNGHANLNAAAVETPSAAVVHSVATSAAPINPVANGAAGIVVDVHPITTPQKSFVFRLPPTRLEHSLLAAHRRVEAADRRVASATSEDDFKCATAALNEAVDAFENVAHLAQRCMSVFRLLPTLSYNFPDNIGDPDRNSCPSVHQDPESLAFPHASLPSDQSPPVPMHRDRKRQRISHADSPSSPPAAASPVATPPLVDADGDLLNTSQVDTS